MNRLEKILLTSAVLITLAGGSIACNKKDYAKETASFNKLIGSYQKEVETMQPWLSQLSENEVPAALALNLRNFREAEKNSMFYNLDSDAMPLLLPQALFTADGIKRKIGRASC